MSPASTYTVFPNTVFAVTGDSSHQRWATKLFHKAVFPKQEGVNRKYALNGGISTRRTIRFTDLGDVFSARFIRLPFISGDSPSRIGAATNRERARSLGSLFQNLLDAFLRRTAD